MKYCLISYFGLGCVLGDWLKVETQRVYEEEINDPNVELQHEETLGIITSVKPNEIKTVVGSVTLKKNVHCIDDEIYYTTEVVKGNRVIPLNSRVQCTAVSSTQKFGDLKFQWRAIKVGPSEFIEYTSDPHK